MDDNLKTPAAPLPAQTRPRISAFAILERTIYRCSYDDCKKEMSPEEAKIHVCAAPAAIEQARPTRSDFVNELIALANGPEIPSGPSWPGEQVRTVLLRAAKVLSGEQARPQPPSRNPFYGPDVPDEADLAQVEADAFAAAEPAPTPSRRGTITILRQLLAYEEHGRYVSSSRIREQLKREEKEAEDRVIKDAAEASAQGTAKVETEAE